MVVPSSDTPQKPHQKFEVVESSPRTGSTSFLLGMSRPFIIIAALVVFVVGGAGVPGWLQVPDLFTQKRDLQEQVDLISETVDRLESENDRLTSNNDRLDRSIDELGKTRDNLNNTVQELLTNLTEINIDLNITSQELQNQVNNLTEANNKYQEANVILENMTQRLEQNVKDFEEDVDSFNGEINRLQNVTYELNNTIAEQNETVKELEDFVVNYTAEVIRLQTLNNQTVESVAFLNQTAFGIGTSFEEGTSELAERIGTIRFLSVTNLRNQKIKRIDGWDCAYRNRANADGIDYALPITDLKSEIEWLDQRIFDEVCLDDSDFESFLNAQYPDVNVNPYQLIEIVTTYTNNAFKYYFPKAGDDGLTPEDWYRASLKCENLGNDTYAWISDSTF